VKNESANSENKNQRPLVRRRLKKKLPAALTANHRTFLLGLFAGESEWQLMKCQPLSQPWPSAGNSRTSPGSKSPLSPEKSA
jgi:hypothetical protein